jgi:hypothetical protein
VFAKEGGTTCPLVHNLQRNSKACTLERSTFVLACEAAGVCVCGGGGGVGWGWGGVGGHRTAHNAALQHVCDGGDGEEGSTTRPLVYNLQCGQQYERAHADTFSAHALEVPVCRVKSSVEAEKGAPHTQPAVRKTHGRI